MPEIQLKQSGFMYSARGSLSKKKDRIQKFKETRDSRYTFQNELNKACVQHDMDFENLKD